MSEDWSHEQMVEYAIRKQRERRQWLADEHSRSPRCYYCRNITIYAPWLCSRPGDHELEFIATVDHVVAKVRGGHDLPDNWVLACRTCNSLKGDMTAKDFIRELKKAGVR